MAKFVPAANSEVATEPTNEVSRGRGRPRVQILKKAGRPAPTADAEPAIAQVFSEIPRSQVTQPRRIRPTGQRSRRPRPQQQPQFNFVESIPLEPEVITTTTQQPILEPRITVVQREQIQFEPQVPRNLPRKFEVIKPVEKKKKFGRIGVLDRYTIQNDDGSLTWGYQSADGSFKEETIGNDCVTRGR